MNDHGKWWILSSSLESLATLLQSLISVTSTTRDFFSGCLHCGTDSIGCLKRREETSNDGAWFDCDQFQPDHPYCYENQVALRITDADDTGLSSSQTRDVNHISRKCNGVFATTSPPPENDAQTLLPSTADNAEEVQRLAPAKSDASTPPAETHNASKYEKYKQSLMDATSFASKLERDHFGQRVDSLRSEGEVLFSALSNFQMSKLDSRSYHRPSIKSPVLERKKMSNHVADFDYTFWDDNDSLTSLEDVSFFGSSDIWKPRELESVFEFYNSSTLTPFTFNSVQQKKSMLNFRGSNEKFEEVFPSALSSSDKLNNFEKNNNEKGFVKVHSMNDNKKHSDKENALVSQFKNIENGSDSEERKCFNTLTKIELKKLIKMCMNIDSVSEFNAVINQSYKETLCCDKLFLYCGKSFNKTLLFDLVKESTKEYLYQYANSLSLTPSYPMGIIENKVTGALEFSKNCQPYQVALLEDIERFKQRMLLYSNLSEFAKVPDEILIENVTSEEIKKEGRQWQNVELEACEIQIKLCQEIFDEVLQKEISFLDQIFSKKLSEYL